MSAVAVFGAGGRLGRLVVAEAVVRGHKVTAVVRDPARYGDLAAAPGVSVEAGDVRDAERVAEIAARHDVVVASVYSPGIPAADLYPAAARALVTGVGSAARLIVVGVASTREVAPGVLLLDTPGFPPEGRDFSLARVAELDVLRAVDPAVDWLLLMPPLEIDRAAVAKALVDEIEASGPGRGAVEVE